MWTRLLAGSLFTLALAVPASAQTSPEWLRKVKPGKTIFVTTQAGQELHGELETSDGSTLSILTRDGKRSVSIREIQKVQRRDPLWNGMLWGGAFATSLGLTSAMQAVTECPAHVPDCETDPVARLMVTTAAAGVLIGGGLDALFNRRQTIHDSGRRAKVLVIATPDRIALSVRF